MSLNAFLHALCIQLLQLYAFINYRQFRTRHPMAVRAHGARNVFGGVARSICKIPF